MHQLLAAFYIHNILLEMFAFLSLAMSVHLDFRPTQVVKHLVSKQLIDHPRVTVLLHGVALIKHTNKRTFYSSAGYANKADFMHIN